MLSQQHLCQKLPKSVGVRWSYRVQLNTSVVFETQCSHVCGINCSDRFMSFSGCNAVCFRLSLFLPLVLVACTITMLNSDDAVTNATKATVRALCCIHSCLRHKLRGTEGRTVWNSEQRRQCKLFSQKFAKLAESSNSFVTSQFTAHVR